MRIEKYCNIYTTRDFDMQGKTAADIQALSLEKVKEQAGIGYGKLASDTAAEWEKQVWKRIPISIEGNEYDNFAVHFAQYHLCLMVPAHDNRMNIARRGYPGKVTGGTASGIRKSSFFRTISLPSRRLRGSWRSTVPAGSA